MSEKYYVTTPIYYASGNLHVGHCFCSILADACARFFRLDGKDVMFLTGSDEHGMKVMRSAEVLGLTPKQFVDGVVDNFKDIFKSIHISYDKFIRTTDKEHVDCVRKIMQKLYDNGDIYQSVYEGLYCVPCETYFSAKDLKDGNCPDCNRPVEKTSEKCYFLKLSKYQDFIEKLFNDNPNFLVPKSRKNEIYNNFIKDGVQDLCLTRTSFDWGIKAPFDEEHVIYVWCDALINYISALGYSSENDENFKKYWPAIHLVGRDITRFHTIIWPILLHAIGLEVPKQVHSTGFITSKGDRISKSKSNGFDVKVLSDRYGADALRYYLLKEGPIFNDVPYESSIFLNTINSDLCNNLGNLVSRTLAMITQYFNGVLPKANEFVNEDKKLIDMCGSLLSDVRKDMEEQRVDNALRKIMSVVDYANKYIDINMPWKLAKEENGQERLATVMYVLSESIRICAVVLQAFLVEIPQKIKNQFNFPESLFTFKSVASFSKKISGLKVTKGDNIFPRLDIAKEIMFLEEPAMNSKESKQVSNKEMKSLTKTEINIQDFDKMNFKVGTILACEKVAGADKLLVSKVDTGDKVRTIVSGVAKSFEPANLVGKQVVVVANLQPVKLRGILSEGMILFAVDEKTGKFSLVSPDSVVANGSEVC